MIAVPGHLSSGPDSVFSGGDFFRDPPRRRILFRQAFLEPGCRECFLFRSQGLAFFLKRKFLRVALPSNQRIADRQSAAATPAKPVKAAQSSFDLKDRYVLPSLDLLSPAPPSTGGSAITGYLLQWTSNGGTTYTTVAGTNPGTAVTKTVTGLTAGTSYRFHVAAINAIGTSAYSTLSTAVTAR